MKTLEYKATKTTIKVYIGGRLWKTWRRNGTTEAIAKGRISTPADLNNALNNT